MNEDSEILAKIYKYRKMILTGKIKLDINGAKKIIGPDVAYHLYKKISSKDIETEDKIESDSE